MSTRVIKSTTQSALLVKFELQSTMSKIYENLKLPKNYTGSIAVYWHQCEEDGFWTYKSFGNWDNCGSSSGGGNERRFPSESTDTGSVEFMYDQLNEMVRYFTELNNRGIGRYDLHASIHDDNSDDIEKYDVRITIDNNRSLDSNVYEEPYNPNCQLANWNFKN